MTYSFQPEKLSEYLLQAFKKLKSEVYFDKTRPILREHLIVFEGNRYSQEGNAAFLDRIDALASALGGTSEAAWTDVSEALLDSIDVLVYPKQLVSKKRANESVTLLDTSDGPECCQHIHWDIVSNRDNNPPLVDRLQLFIDMQPEGFVLGMLWVLLIGTELDKGFASSSYGNRIRKSVAKEGKSALSWSPYVFEPYFRNMRAGVTRR